MNCHNECVIGYLCPIFHARFSGACFTTMHERLRVIQHRDARIADLEREIATRSADESAAAGSLLVAIPEPGTDAAKLLKVVINQRLREDELKREVERLRGVGIVDRAIEEITRYGGIDGDHHRSWLLQEVLAILSGWDTERLKKELTAMEWEPGIPP
jgi:hypothetical protein